ncbi:MAG TPA: glycosyltransferase family 39 protein [Candidatus Eisenbacteria bacterium]|jgi:hypothetical protein
MSAATRARARVGDEEPRWWRGALIALFVLALAWKLVCLVRWIRNPIYPDLSADSAAYWGWAQLIARGALVGHNAFFLGPLYAYLLALFHPLPGAPPTAPLVAQCVLGSATCVLLSLAARAVCSRPHALAVGVLAAGNAMATLLDLSVLSESLLWFLGAVFLCLQLSALGTTRPRAHALGSGLVLGLMSLARPSFGLLLVPAGLAAAARGGTRQAARSLLLASAVALACCAPVLIRHLALGYGFIPWTYSLGYNAYVGNGPGATGAYVSSVDAGAARPTSLADVEGGASGDGREVIAQATGVRLNPGQSSAWWLRATWSSVTTSPGRIVRLWVRKAGLGVNHVEASQVEDLDVHERIHGPLGIPFAGNFGFVGVLGLAGLVLIARRAEGRILIAHAVAVWAPMLVFFVTDRYRHHLTLPLLVTCGPALEMATLSLRRAHRAPLPLARALVPVAVAGLIVWLPLIRASRWRTEFLAHRALAEAEIRNGDWPDGEAELTLALAPASLSRLPVARSTAAREAVAGAMQSLAGAYAQRGRFAESELWLAHALEYVPACQALRQDHALMLALTGRSRDAIDAMRQIGLDGGSLVEGTNAIARSAVARQDWNSAEAALRASLALDSTQEMPNVVLVRLLATQHRTEEERAAFERLPGRGIAPAVVLREGAALRLVSEATRGR